MKTRKKFEETLGLVSKLTPEDLAKTEIALQHLATELGDPDEAPNKKAVLSRLLKEVPANVGTILKNIQAIYTEVHPAGSQGPQAAAITEKLLALTPENQALVNHEISAKLDILQEILSNTHFDSFVHLSPFHEATISKRQELEGVLAETERLDKEAKDKIEEYKKEIGYTEDLESLYHAIVQKRSELAPAAQKIIEELYDSKRAAVTAFDLKLDEEVKAGLRHDRKQENDQRLFLADKKNQAMEKLQVEKAPSNKQTSRFPLRHAVIQFFAPLRNKIQAVKKQRADKKAARNPEGHKGPNRS